MNGNKLRSLRESKGLLQKQLGDILGISPSTIGMYEQCRREPDNATLKKIANFFEVSVDYLLDNNFELTKRDKEMQEKQALENALKSIGYMKDSEDLTKDELERLMKFVKNNKDFIKGIK